MQDKEVLRDFPMPKTGKCRPFGSGVSLFEFQREFCTRTTATVAVTEAQEQSVEQRQRDVFESHRHRTFSLAFYMTGSEIEAEEILAKTFVRAFQKDAEPDGFGVDRSLVCELAQRFSLRQEEPLATTSQGSGLGGANVHRNDLETAIRGLPANERLVFLLRDVEAYSPEATAKLLEAPAPEIERTLFSAHLRLRGLLADLARCATEAA
jgi:RNA polymerase sigma-70 factor (ECF subfamily)